MKNKLWMAIFKLEPPICTCGRPMTVLEVSRFHKEYLILRATDDGDPDKEKGFYTLYSIKDMKTFGHGYVHLSRKVALQDVTKFERGIIK